MTRMIERWFPCAEVSANSNAGWGSGNTERSLFTWFAARPTAQAKAAVICSLLPWPDDEAEQQKLQTLVQEAMTGRYAASSLLRAAIEESNPNGTSVLDPFSGRGMIPLEAARLGVRSYGFDYSPVATLASHLLADYPFHDWSSEPKLPIVSNPADGLYDLRPRLLVDVESLLAEVGRRWSTEVADFYPAVDGRQPWGYLWAVTLPCQECGHRFPLIGAYELRKASHRKDPATGQRFRDPGQSFYIDGDIKSGHFSVVVHDGPPSHTPILTNAIDAAGKKIRGKAARCPFCGQSHPVKTHQRMAAEGLGTDALLIVADLDPVLGKTYRTPTDDEVKAVGRATACLSTEPPFSPVLPAVPDEPIPPEIGALVRPQLYGAATYGDLMCDRQTLATVRLARSISQLAEELAAAGLSREYVRALAGYATAALIRKLRRSTRGCALQPALNKVTDLFANQGTLSFSYDFFEAGIGEGPGTWDSLAASTTATLRSLLEDIQGSPTQVALGSAVTLPLRDSSVGVVVTDPPYDALIYYSDSSDFFYSWIKRALGTTYPELTIPRDPRGLQDKTEEIIVWGHRAGPDEHRDRAHYDTHIARAFSDMRRVVESDGVVTIVFGHGEPEVWQRLLRAISQAGLVMTASWPANTEAGGSNGGMASIETTLTMACRPAPSHRGTGRKGAVETEIKAEIKRRYPDWERWGLAPADMLMAAAGPAMEVVGRYESVLDATGEPVDIYTFLPLARAAVQDAMAVEVDNQPLETFDARTRFALWWVRLYGRQTQAKSELRWQSLASSMDSADVRDLVPDSEKGVAFTTANRFKSHITTDSAVIEVVLALAAASEDGLTSMGEALAASGRTSDDPYLWAAIKFLVDRLPDSDPDAIALSRVLRTRDGISNAAQTIVTSEVSRQHELRRDEAQWRLL
jgi:putative DNA methylase